jgi:hydroxymethylbilane synthase
MNDAAGDLMTGLTISPPAARAAPAVRPHRPALPLRVGTRASPLALAQTRSFLALLARICPVLSGMDVFCEHAIQTTGDKVLDRPLAEIGGKGLFAKEIHQALSDGRIDFAVHSLKDLETGLPPGISLACVLKREDPRDVLILGPDLHDAAQDQTGADPFAAIPRGALIGTCSVRRQAQLLAARPDLRITTMRGNVQSRLAKVRGGVCDGSLLALAGLNRLGLESEASVVIPAEIMVPSACQGIVGITVRSADREVIELLSAIEDRSARVCATAERALQAALDGSCATPVGAHATLAGSVLTLTGLVASVDGGFQLRRQMRGAPADAERMGREMGLGLRADSPAAIFH